MAGRCATVDPGDARVVEQVEIRLLEQHAGGETGIILVKGGLEREAARRAAEMDEHGERPPAEIERPHLEPAGSGRGGQDGAKPGLGPAVAGERRYRAPLPHARLQIATGIPTSVKTRTPTEAAIRTPGQR